MTPLSILTSPEFYVIMVVIAAAVVAMAVRPSQRGQARSFFYAATLLSSADESRPSLSVTCLDDGGVQLMRGGLRSLVNSSGAVSVAVTIIGFDVSIVERITPTGPGDGVPVDAAMIIMDCLARERYHVRYAGADGSLCVFTLHNRPGIAFRRDLLV